MREGVVRGCSLNYPANATEPSGRWRGERRRNVPSASAAFRFLHRFHDEEEKNRRRGHTAFIPAATADLSALGKVNADLLDFVGSHTGQRQATLDMDATLIETHKEFSVFQSTQKSAILMGSRFGCNWG